MSYSNWVRLYVKREEKNLSINLVMLPQRDEAEVEETLPTKHESDSWLHILYTTTVLVFRFIVSCRQSLSDRPWSVPRSRIVLSLCLHLRITWAYILELTSVELISFPFDPLSVWSTVKPFLTHGDYFARYSYWILGFGNVIWALRGSAKCAVAFILKVSCVHLQVWNCFRKSSSWALKC